MFALFNLISVMRDSELNNFQDVIIGLYGCLIVTMISLLKICRVVMAIAEIFPDSYS
jgi:hypothetical protein